MAASRARSALDPGGKPALKAFAAAAGRFAAGLAAVLVVGLIVVVALAIALYRSYAADFVPPEEAAVNRPSAGARVYDRNGVLLYQYVDDREGLRNPVRLSDVSAAFLAATIATEDFNFFSNPGVNHKGLVRAALENLNPFQDDKDLLEGAGGSSITQQLVKNVYISPEDRTKRSIDRKMREVVYALELTKRYPKKQILEWYVNQINYGGVYSGVEAASQGYFGKPAKDLTLAEAALLAGIPQSPASYDPRTSLQAAIERRNDVLALLASHPRIAIGQDVYFVPDQAEIQAAMQEPVEVLPPRFPIEAPHFVLTYVGPQLEAMYGRSAVLHDGLIVTTSLDLELQRRSQEILERWIQAFEASSNTHNGAMMIMTPDNGEVLVMIGSRDYYREDIDGQVNNLLARNSPGSSFKPFVYLTTFLELGWSPGTIIQDSPITYREVNGDVFQPQNPTVNSYRGNISIRDALGNSLNVPAFKAAQIVGVDKVVQQAKKLGFTTLVGQYGPSIAIGGVDLTPAELTYGYTVLANGGVMVGQDAVAPGRPDLSQLQPVSILRVTDARGEVRFDIERERRKRRILPEEHAFLVTNILTDPRATCVTFGCGGIQVPGYQVAVKTGTSQPYDPRGPNRGKIGETWAFGYTRDFVVGVWAGNSDNSPLVNILSTSISFRAMRDAMLAAYAGRPQTPWEQPAGVARSRTCMHAPALPSTVFAPAPGAPALRTGASRPGQCADDWVVRGGNDGAARQEPPPLEVPPGMRAVDRRTGMPAEPTTPTEFVELRPVETPEAPQPAPQQPEPTRAAPAGGSAAIASPGGGSVSGAVVVRGTASSPDMLYYRLEYSGPSGVWSSIGQWSTPVVSDALATWSTAGLPPGQYTLRLTVQDAVRGPIVATVTVNVSR
ncbi:MAG TPA: transglycosylase domain-containing protein [Dehalococcoidia bacterium]|nr:transglycosylase domain-containing protein [Dehalococcoidia bacterium]